MPAPDMRLLRQQLNKTCTTALEAAAAACIERTHYEITTEHLLTALLDNNGTDLTRIIAHYQMDGAKIRRACQRCLEDLKIGNSGRPQFSPFLADWLADGWQVASLELSLPKIRSGALLLALLRNTTRTYITDYTDELGKVNAEDLKKNFGKITEDSIENEGAGDQSAQSRDRKGAVAGAAGTGEALQQFTTDLTAKAREGRVDPVLGREREIRQCVDILMRRFQNNPLIVGEPGTGKTAIVEGLALRIAAGDVPPVLQNVTLLSLDVGLLSAGASVKGEFERRLKGVIAEVNASNAAGKPIILFIDEAHTLIGGGGSSNDAANLLKPALARGELRTIAATTFSEYKKYIEKDAPFAQRFGLIRLEEPSVPVCTDMLRGTKDKFENHHKVVILDDALKAAVAMSNQYLTEAQLPRKAVSLLDTACARVAVGLASTPGSLEDIRRRILQLDTAIRAIERDQDAGNPHDAGELAAMKTDRIAQQKAQDELEATWKQEKDLAGEVIKLREEISTARKAASDEATKRRSDEVKSEPAAGAAGGGAAAAKSEREGGVRAGEAQASGRAGDATAADGPDSSPSSLRRSVASSLRPVDEIRRDLDAATKKLESFIGKRPPLVPMQVDTEVVSQILSDWTGIPAGSMVKDQAAAMLTFEERIGTRIIGQDHAIHEIGKRLRIASGKLHDPVLPLAVIFMVGPSGTGKTETALGVADLIFGGERFMTTINMTEYSSSMNVSRLIGSAPGLVGFGEGGVLTEAVRKRPYSVVLLDEMEKAHLDVNLLFMQVFDKGALNDSEGRVASFKNTVIMLTSNEGSDMIHEMCADGEKPTLEEMRVAIQPALEKRFTPAFVGRTTVIPFYPLSNESLRKIVDLKMNKIRKRLAEIYKIKLDLTPAVGDEIAKRCQTVTTGARLINLIINETVLPEIAKKVLETMGSDAKPSKLTVDVGDGGAFTYAMA